MDETRVTKEHFRRFFLGERSEQPTSRASLDVAHGRDKFLEHTDDRLVIVF